MEFGILGPLQVVDGARHVELGPPQQRALLALLILNANRVVTTDRILDELWGDEAVGKENALWVYISRLRSALEPERTERGQSSVLVTRDHGYSLQVDPTAIDAHEFEQVVADGSALLKEDPARASDVLAGGLALWRGAALEEFGYRDFAQLEIARLESLRLAATENRIEADLRNGKSGELIGELEALIALHPTRESLVAQLMLALYQAGRQADALRAYESFSRSLGDQVGLEPSPDLRRLEEQMLLHDPGLRVRLPVVGRIGSSSASVNPFKGLRAFGEEDAPHFFGRDRQVADLARRVTGEGGLITLVGPSGSGKSSILRAGLVPAIRKGDGGGQSKWRVAQMVPGAHPFVELEAALLRSSLDTPDSLADLVMDPVNGALRAVLRVLPEDMSLLLVIDQFEELFTLTDRDERDRFIANLIPMIDDPHGRISLVVGLRASFYDRPLAYPAFAERLGGSIVNVVPPTSDELEQAAQKPAEAVGVYFSPSLLAALLADVVGRPGSLPLFQYTLTELFDRRTEDVLSLEDYREMRGITGVLTRKADELFADLSPEEQEVARQLFLRLVTIADNSEWGRRRVPASEILSLDVDAVAAQKVVETFSQHHLLTLDRDAVNGSPTVEVAHEALLTEWPLLNSWIEDGREDVKRVAALDAAVREWDESGRHPDFLLTGSRLEAYESWAAGSTLELTSQQRLYLEAATESRTRSDREEQERNILAEETGRKARRRLWGLVTAGLLLVGAAAVLFLVATQPEPFSVAVIAPSVAPYESSLVATGIARAERELPVEVDFRRRVASLEDEYRALASAGTDLIFIDPGNSGWDWVVDIIDEFPDTAFAVVDGLVPPAGAHSTFLADEEGGYLAGLAAGVTTETGVVGFVGGRQSETTERWRAGFEAGAKAAHAEVEVVSIYIGDDPTVWQDIEGAAEAADRLFDLDADVLLTFAEDANVGVIEAASENSQRTGVHRWVIGSGSDWSVEVPDRLRAHVLTSAFKRWDVAMFEVIRSFTQGEFEPGIEVLTLEDDAIGLAESEYLAVDDQDRIDGLSTRLADDSDAIQPVPTLQLLPPPGMEETEPVSVTWDGTVCGFSGSTTYAADTSFRIEFVNTTSTYRQFWALHHRVGSFDVPIEVLVAPASTHIGYMSPGIGDVEINCGPDLRDGSAPDPATAATLTLE